MRRLWDCLIAKRGMQMVEEVLPDCLVDSIHALDKDAAAMEPINPTMEEG